MIGFVFLTYRFLEPIAEFTEVLDQTQTAVAGLRRVLGVLDIPVGPPPPDRIAGRCRRGGSTSTSDDVTFSYRSRAERDLSDDTGARVTSTFTSRPASRSRWWVPRVPARPRSGV